MTTREETSSKDTSSAPTRTMRRRSSLAALGSSINRSLRRLSLFGSRRSVGNLKEEEQLQFILNALSEEEIEVAARSSYTYLKNPKDTNRNAYAKQFALRFLRSKKDEKKALAKMQSTIQFRTEIDIDGLRLAFEDLDSEYHEPLKEQLKSKMLKVQGYDKEGRATYIFTPRNVQGHDEEWTLKEHIYTLERAIACSHAPDKTVNAVVDFNGFSVTQHAPPTHIGKQFMLTLRNHYAGSVNQIFLVDAPFAFNALWTIFKPFVGSKTRHKIHFVKSNHSKLKKWYNDDQAASWMMPGGTKNREFDLDEYLHETAFNEAFDE